jgi:hypothetical protein
VSQRDPLLALLTAISAAVLGRREPAVAARFGMGFLDQALRAGVSVVVEVRFTGFTVRGVAVAAGNPVLLRAAGRLIVLKLSRLGLTGEASEDDLRALLEILSRDPRLVEAEGGLVASLTAAAPHGVYVATTAGELYKPPPRPPGEPDPAARTPTTAVAPTIPEAGPATAAGEGDDAIEGMIRSLAGSAGLPAFTAAAGAIADEASRHLRAGELAVAVPLLQALVEEADRQEHCPEFRDAARRHLHAAMDGPALSGMVDAVAGGAPGTPETVAMLPELGEEAAVAFQSLLHGNGDEELVRDLFAALARSAGGRERLLQTALSEPESPAASRIFSLANVPGLEAEFARRLAEAAARHPAPEVRHAGARAAGALGGRHGVRILAQLLDDRKRSVKLRALAEMARIGHPAGVPHLAELLDAGAEEEVEIAAVDALGASALPDAIPPLLAVLGRRQLFSGKRLQKRKLAAVRALGRVPDRRAREVLTHLASSRDTALAAEAARALKAPREGA